MTCGGNKPCGCRDCGGYTLDTKGRRPEEARSMGSRLRRAWSGGDRSDETSVSPIGSRIRVVESAGSLGSRLREAWVPGGASPEEAPGIPVGSALARPWAPPDHEPPLPTTDEIRFGIRPTMEERPEFQLPVGGQDFLGLITKLPSEPALRAEAARLLMQMQRVWWPFLAEQMVAVPIEWRIDVVRAWSDVAALIPAVWVRIGVQLVEDQAVAVRIETLRELATILMTIAPQFYQDAIDLLGGTTPASDGLLTIMGDAEAMMVRGGVPRERWIETLREFAKSHPKWLTPPSVLASTFTVLSSSAQVPPRHWIAPPPAPQAVCVVTDFDPAWGEPPRWYRGVPVRFDRALGAYELDEGLRSRYQYDDSGQMILSAADADVDPAVALEVRRRYAQGQAVIQPFKRPGSPTWEFRWIARVRADRCNPI